MSKNKHNNAYLNEEEENEKTENELEDETVDEVCDEFVNETSELKKENEDLKKKIEELTKQSDDYKDKWYRVPCASVPVVDTVGAGDSLSAGFLAQYIKTGDLERSLIAGSHIADFVVTQRGAIPEYDEELKTYLRSMGIL